MESLPVGNNMMLYVAISLPILIFIFKSLFSTKQSSNNLPPSPPSIPILGHLHLMKFPIHRAFSALSQKYGPILHIKLGSCPLILVSSPSLVEECFTKNDIVLASRPLMLIDKRVTYNYNIIPAAPYGDGWRTLRRVGTTEILSINRLNLFADVRKEEIEYVCTRLYRKATAGKAKVVLVDLFKDMTLNVIMRMVAGKRYFCEDSIVSEQEKTEFDEVIRDTIDNDAPNLVVFFPFLKYVIGDSHGRKLDKIAQKNEKLLQGLLDDCKRNKESTITNHLLNLQQADPQTYTDEMIKGFILTMLLAGTHTMVATMEWTMCNLVNHPQILKKVQKEVDSEIGQEKLMDDADISKLVYLQKCFQENLRVCPPAPLLVPHMSTADCKVGGYTIPKDTMIMVNSWDIHRDPSNWDDPLSFRPERFDDKLPNEEQFKYLPFGHGRRACPGANMAHYLINRTLGTIIQCFEWERTGKELVDMSEAVGGLTMAKGKPLEVICKPRPIAHKLFS